MAEYPFAENDPREGLFEHQNFEGLRNNVGSEGFGLGDLEVALNVDIDDALTIRRRKGYSAPVTAAVDRALWAKGSVCLGVGSNALKLISSAFGTTALRSGLTANRDVSYTPVADRVYYSNGAESGVVQNGQHRTWGIAPPTVPAATLTGGTLLAGNYQFAVTYLRADGQESGTGRAGAITLAAAGGIALSAIPISADAGVVAKNIYASPVGSEVLYRCGTIANATTTFTIAAIQMDSQPLLTQFLQPPPAGDFIGYINGVMLVAKDNRLYPSEAYSPELFDYRKAVPFLDRITMVETGDSKVDGVWIGTENQVVFLRGPSPDKWEFEVAADYGVIPGTLAYTDGELIGDGELKGDHVAFFATTRGLCTGTSKGVFTNMTEARFAYPSMDRGAGIVRRHRGIAQYLVSLEGIETAGNVAS